MTTGGKVDDKSLGYMVEKMRLLNMGYDAFAALDIRNQRRVIAYFAVWGYDIPPEISAHMVDQEAALRTLRESMGLDID